MSLFLNFCRVAGAVAVLLVFPLVHLVLAALNFVIHFGVMALQLFVTRFAAAEPECSEPLPDEPFVSIHVPTHNEPPEVVMQTLDSLSKLKWANYEVLVIDNNTSDPALWQPIQSYCEALGSRFRFFHVEGLSGYKAGAMNYVRQWMSPKTEFIFVVDADYVVDRKALRIALRYFTDEKIGLIQFPQDYRNITDANRGIALDYKHYFSGFMNVANALGCVASTGTLALINLKALEKIGGFNAKFITEDAQLGLQLALNGYRSIYVNKSIGAGLIPHDLQDLKKQRWRWAFGNAQILRRQWKKMLMSRELSWKQKLGFFSHLTAWFNFNLVPSLSLIGLAIYSVFRDLSEAQIYTVVISGFTLSSYLFLKYGIIHYSLRRDGHSLQEIWKGYLSHLGLGWIFSASWIKCLHNDGAPFIRTNKFIGKVTPGVLQCTLAEMLLGIGLMSAGIIFTAADFVIGPIAAMVMCGAGLAVYWVGAQTRHTFEVTSRLFPVMNVEDGTNSKAA